MASARVGRNEPCPCGSGRKFKHCCGLAGAAGAAGAPKSAHFPVEAGIQAQRWVAAGLAHHQRGDHGQAESAYRRALQCQPDYPEALHLLGVLAYEFGQYTLAIDLIGQALSRGEQFGMLYNLGLACHAVGRIDDALGHYRRVIELAPVFAPAHNSVGVALLDLGQPAGAADAFAEAVRLEPSLMEARSNRLLCRLYDPLLASADLALDHRAEGAWYRNHLGAVPGFAPEPAQPRLRVGLVSGDLRQHPVGLMLEGVLAELVRQPVELVLYANNPRSDELSERLQRLPLTWRPIFGLDDHAVLRQVREDGIEVLVDLSGHTAHNRLSLFARRAAPVQLSWLGYGAGTGLEAMDYLLTDPFCVTPEEADHYIEQLWPLPHTRLVYSPPTVGPAVSPLPALGRGSPCFGCFNNLAKLNEPVLACWAALMRELPAAHLFFKSRQFDQNSGRTALRQALSNAGIDLARVKIEGFTSYVDYLSAYAEVDLALDPFPFPGGATSLDGLWMGVPMLTLRGRHMIGRQGESLLQNLGLQDWIADSPDDYVRRALRLSADLPGLARLRAELRPRLLASPLCDKVGLAAALLQAWTAMRNKALIGVT